MPTPTIGDWEGIPSKLQPRRNCHGHELLKQKLASIGHEYLYNTAVLASWTVELVLLQVGCSNHATLFTNMDSVGI